MPWPSYIDGCYPLVGRPRYPELWEGCIGAWAPCLGPTGATLHDMSQYHRDGTLTNMDVSSDWVLSGGRYALDFDGSNDFVDCGSQWELKGPCAVSAWINTSTVSAGPRCVFANCNVGGALQDISAEINRAPGRLGILWGDKAIAASTATLSADRWYHCVWQRAGTPGNWSAEFYIDGLFDSATASSVAPNGIIGTNFNAIGRLGGAGVFYWSGRISDVRVYRLALTGENIRKLSRHPGIANEVEEPAAYTAAQIAAFKAAWAHRRRLLIGAGTL